MEITYFTDKVNLIWLFREVHISRGENQALNSGPFWYQFTKDLRNNTFLSVWSEPLCYHPDRAPEQLILAES